MPLDLFVINSTVVRGFFANLLLSFPIVATWPLAPCRGFHAARGRAFRVEKEAPTLPTCSPQPLLPFLPLFPGSRSPFFSSPSSPLRRRSLLLVAAVWRRPARIEDHRKLRRRLLLLREQGIEPGGPEPDAIVLALPCRGRHPPLSSSPIPSPSTIPSPSRPRARAPG